MSDLVDSYDFYLPPELIASKPLEDKLDAKLLVYKRATDEILHLKFKDLPNILPKCAIVFNDTKVIKARIFGQKMTGGKIELLLNAPLVDNKFSVYIRGSVKKDQTLLFSNNLKCVVLELKGDGLRVVKFYKDDTLLDQSEVFEIFNEIGHIPLPPYIKRKDLKEDEEWYQSIFAKEYGAVAAPTASLHFDTNLLNSLKKDHPIFYITLHVGAGTFKPIEVKNINEHKMHKENFFIPDDTANLIKSNTPILGVGTTSTRCIEYYARTNIKSGWCDLFLNLKNTPIRQEYLLTNFHLPKSTLIMLVSSFIGFDKTFEIYNEAIKNRYRFYSYGDAMLII